MRKGGVTLTTLSVSWRCMPICILKLLGVDFTGSSEYTIIVAVSLEVVLEFKFRHTTAKDTQYGRSVAADDKLCPNLRRKYIDFSNLFFPYAQIVSYGNLLFENKDAGFVLLKKKLIVRRSSPKILSIWHQLTRNQNSPSLLAVPGIIYELPLSNTRSRWL